MRGGSRAAARKRVFIPGYRGCVQHMSETMFGTYANCASQAYEHAKRGIGPDPNAELKPSANDYYLL